MTKFTEEQRCVILADWLDGVEVRVIAKKYGCCVSYASRTAKLAGLKRPTKVKRVDRDWIFVKSKNSRKPIPKKRDWLNVNSAP